jgi:hypothetical protein
MPRQPDVPQGALMQPVEIEVLRQSFLRDGFVHLESAFSQELADECRELLWRDVGCDREDRSSWTLPVVRLGDHAEPPFQRAANTPALHAAFDALVGRGRWVARPSLGGFPIRFPSESDPGDTGWHADAGFYGDDGSLRLNWRSKGRALLMLFLFSDVGEDDAPTRIKVGSHFEVPRLLEPAGEDGLTFIELAARFDPGRDYPIALATGAAGDVYLCHPFLVHAAQRHRGTTPKFMAQPPLYPAEPIELDRADGDYSPVEQAIRIGLERGQ